MTRACAACGEVTFTAPVLAICAGGGDLVEPVNLSPSQELRCCATGKCDAYFILVSRSVEAYTGKPLRWRWARVVFTDGDGVGLKFHGAAQELARA